MSAALFDVISGGNAFTNPLTSLSGNSLGLVSAGKATTASLSGVTDTQLQGALAAGGLTTDKLTATTTMFTGAATGVGTLVSYGDRSISEAYQRIGTSTSYKNGLTGIGRAPTNCDLINNAFGVVQNAGKQFLAALENTLNAVTGKLNELWNLVQQGISAGLAKIQALAAEVTSAINTAMTAINKVIQDIENAIAAELAHIQNMISACLNFSFANVINEWFKDSCAAGIIKSIGTKDLNDALK